MKANLYNSSYLDYNNKRFHFELKESNDMSNLLSISSNLITSLNDEFNFKPVSDMTATLTVSFEGYDLLKQVNYIEIIPEIERTGTIIRRYDFLRRNNFYYVTNVEILNGTSVQYSLRLDVYATYGYQLYQNNPIIEVQRAHTQRYITVDNTNYICDVEGKTSFIRSKEEVDCSRYLLSPSVDIITPKYWLNGYENFSEDIRNKLDQNYVGWLVVDIEKQDSPATIEERVTREIIQLENDSSITRVSNYTSITLPYAILCAPIIAANNDGLFTQIGASQDNTYLGITSKISAEASGETDIDGGRVYDLLNESLTSRQIYSMYLSYAPLAFYNGNTDFTDPLAEHLTISPNNPNCLMVEPAVRNRGKIDSFILQGLQTGEKPLGALHMYSIGLFNTSMYTHIPYSDLGLNSEEFEPLMSIITKGSVTYTSPRVKDPKVFNMPSYSLRQVFNDNVTEYSILDALMYYKEEGTFRGDIMMFYYENFNSGSIDRYISLAGFSGSQTIYSTFNNYLENSKGSKDSIVSTLPIIDDSYTSFIRQQQASAITSTVMSTISKTLMLTPFIAANPAMAAGIIGGQAVGALGNFMSQAQRARDADDVLKNPSNNVFYDLKLGRNGHPRIAISKANDRDIHAIDDMYYFNGYAMNNSVNYQSLFTRCSFNFILSNDLVIGESISGITSNQRKEINDMFANGVTLLSEHTLSNYSNITEFYGKVANYEKVLLQEEN